VSLSFLYTTYSFPWNRRCNTCGEYIYKGKKFNARKETVEGEDYYGIKIFRFYIKWCVVLVTVPRGVLTARSSTLCSAEITFKTDPKNTDYSAEHGASRNFEPWREEKAVEEEDRLAKLEEEENNPMKVLENRTIDSKREMDVLDALHDIRARNARNERMGQTDDIITRIGREEVVSPEDEQRRREEEEDERLVREVFSKVSVPGAGPSHKSGEDREEMPASTVVTVKRKADDVEPDLKTLLPESTRAMVNAMSSSIQPPKKKKVGNSKSLGIKLVKKR
jgi:cell division protein FtsN